MQDIQYLVLFLNSEHFLRQVSQDATKYAALQYLPGKVICNAPQSFQPLLEVTVSNEQHTFILEQNELIVILVITSSSKVSLTCLTC